MTGTTSAAIAIPRRQDHTRSGQGPYRFRLRRDLGCLPPAALDGEPAMHDTFAVDPRPGQGELYTGVPGCGILRISPDLVTQDLIDLPDRLRAVNFHSTRIGGFDGQWRLFLAANNDERVVVLSLEGDVEFVLPRPEFEQYRDPETPYKPTDTVLVGDRLLVADGYGANYVSTVDIRTRRWASIFGGRTDDPAEDGRFATAHGLNVNPVHGRLDICDRPHARVQAHEVDGTFVASQTFPEGAFLCGISYLEHRDRWLGVIGCLRDPGHESGRPAPIYIIDAETYEILSTVRPKEELGVELAQHIHNAVLHEHDGALYLVCQAWNPGHYFVLEQI